MTRIGGGRSLLHVPTVPNSTFVPDSPFIDSWLIRHSLWPAVLYTVTLMVVGTIGNTLVLFVYRRHFRHSVTRMFIYSLAILDLGNCLITMPAELMILIRFASFPSASWCKMSRWLTYIFNGTSSCLLISIALDRYYKVCHPTVSFLTVFRARIVCISSLIFCTFVSAPALVLYGDVNLRLIIVSDHVHILGLTDESIDQEVTDPNLERHVVNGTFCLVSTDYIDTHLPTIFYVLWAIVYVIMVIVVVFSYSHVARTMFYLRSRHARLFSFFQAYRGSNSAILDGPPEGEQNGEEGGGSVMEGEDSNVNGPSAASDNDTCREDQIKQEMSRIHDDIQDGGGRLNIPRVTSQALATSRERFINDVTGSNEAFASREVSLGSKDVFYGSADSNVKDDKNRETHHQSLEIGLDHVTSSGIGMSEEQMAKHTNHEPRDIINTHRKKIRRQKSTKETSSSAPNVNKITRSHDELKRKSTKSQIPKIKIHKLRDANSTESEDSDENKDVDDDVRYRDIYSNPMFSNSLLLRRIKSMNNVRSGATALHKLHIPSAGEDRSKKRTLSVKLTGQRKKSKSFHDVSKLKGGTKTVGLLAAHTTASFEELDNGEFTEKTMTLTRTSPKGSKRVVVLPLTGLSTKAAATIVEQHAELSAMPIKGSLKKGVRLDSRKAQYQSDSRLDRRRDTCEDLEMKVTFRPKSSTTNQEVAGTRKEKGKGSSSQSDLKTPASLQTPRTPRKAVVSTADLLKEQHRRNSLHPFRTSRMLFVISLVFVISFCPFFIIAIMRSALGSDFLKHLSNVTLGVVSVFIRSSLISNAVNPIVYGLLSAHFRKECKNLARSICRC